MLLILLFLTSPLADPPRNLQLKAFMEGGKGTSVILLCTVESNPLSHITLLKEGQLLASSPSTEGDRLRQSIRISSSPNALRLELQDATEEDEGEYGCWAQSQLGSTHTALPLRVHGESVGGGTRGWGPPEVDWCWHQGVWTK